MSEGEPGKPGEYGQPGTDGGGHGGRGGAGGRGGRGGKSMSQRRALFGYLAVVLVAFLAVGYYQLQTNRRLNRSDLHSCEQRQILARNQIFVFQTLQHLLNAELNEENISPVVRDQLLVHLKTARRKLTVDNPERPC